MNVGSQPSKRSLDTLRLRHRVLQAVRRYFDALGYVEVDTPALVRCPGLELHLDAFEVQVGKEKRYLHTSPELAMKRLLCEGLGDCYQVAKVFRADECGEHHNPEFTLLEWYSVGKDLDGLISQTEALLSEVALAVLGSTEVPGAGGKGLDLRPPWPRISVAEAFLLHAGVEMKDVLPDEDRFFRLLVERIEPALESARPTILYGYPAAMASLARLNAEDPGIADRFEVYANGIELCNGFAELTDPVEQRRRFEVQRSLRSACDKTAYPTDERFLTSLEHGMPECAGNALGIDRLLMLLSGSRTIADVMSFTTRES